MTTKSLQVFDSAFILNLLDFADQILSKIKYETIKALVMSLHVKID